jgi:hypothetical protein
LLETAFPSLTHAYNPSKDISVTSLNFITTVKSSCDTENEFYTIALFHTGKEEQEMKNNGRSPS